MVFKSNNKHLITAVIASIALAVGFNFVGCSDDSKKDPALSEIIKISDSSLELKVNESDVLIVSGTNSEIIWSSSDESVATVDDGEVTAVGIGNATIEATTTSGAKTSCVVFVLGSNGASLRLSPAVVEVKKGETYQLKIGNTYDEDIELISSNEDIATVDENGLVTAKKAGNVTITMKAETKTLTSTVSVKHTWGEYKLVWSDEFNGSALDNNTWTIETGGGGWGNNELQYYTDRTENVRVKDGCLEIEARKESFGGREYTSARLNSKGKKAFCYGKIEARIKFPGGKGTWPAFWMMGNNHGTVGWPRCGEIDIIEHVGSVPNRCSFALHTPEKNGTKGNNWHALATVANLVSEFHTYGVEWVQEESLGCDEIRFYVDDKVYATATEGTIDNPSSWPFNKEEFIIFNMAIGGNMGGAVDNTIFSQERIMYVDWVRVYQRSEIE